VPVGATLSRIAGEGGSGHRPETGEGRPRTKIAVPLLPHIANFDDLDPLRAEPDIELVFVRAGNPVPGDAALIVLPGSKATLADLAALRREGWDIDILAHRRRGGHVLGICGGYQMLGRSIADPEGHEGPAETASGLGLLDVDTTLGDKKHLGTVNGTETQSGAPVNGYEMHLGLTQGPDRARSMLSLGGRMDGAVSADGKVSGCYLHGLFASDAFRRVFLSRLGAIPGGLDYEASIEATLDKLADHLATSLDLAAILASARPPRLTKAA
jgi:adenosylcobyric acid synthase